MKNEKLKIFLAAVGNVVLFTLLFSITVILALLVSFSFIGPNFIAISNVATPLFCGFLPAYTLFFNYRFKKKANWKVSYLRPALIFPVLFGLAFTWTMFERNPKNIFEVFVLDPIPNEISNIRARDISGGFETEIIVTFNATPQSIEEIIKANELKLDQDTDILEKNPNDFFEGLNWNQDWQRYLRLERDDEVIIVLWVNLDTFEAVYWFLAY
jgi:hypothetical protein